MGLNVEKDRSMKKTKQIRIVATDGDKYWDLYWIVQNRKGDFYYGPISKDFKDCGYDKLSRHVSGWINDPIKKKLSESAGVEMPRLKVPKLGSVEEIEFLTAYSIPRNFFDKDGFLRLRNNKRYDDIMLIDVRNYKSRININPGFVTAGCLGHIPEHLSRINNLRQFYISVVTNPYTVVISSDN